MARGDRYAEQKKLREAVIEYRNALNVDGRYGEARYKLADTYERLGDLPNALREFVRAAESLPDRDDVQLKAAQYLLQSGGFDDAKRIATALVKKNARNLDAELVLANSLAGLKDLPAAIKELETALQLDPRRIGTYLNLAAYHSLNGNVAAADAVLRKALEVEPGSVDVRLGLVNILRSSGDVAKAEVLLREVLAAQPAHVMANRILAEFYLQSGRIKDAEIPLRTLAEVAKTVADRLALAEYYIKANRGGEAIPVLTAIAAEPEGRVPATLLLARVDYADRRREQAHKRLDDLLAASPINANALLLKAQFLATEGRLDEALSRAQSAASAEPRLAAAHYAVGLVHIQKNDTTQAVKAFNEVLKLDPGSIDAALQIAKIQLASGNAELALKSVEDVVRKQPSNFDGRVTRVRALIARGDLARAESEASALVALAPRSAEAQVMVGSIAAAKKNYPAARGAFTRAQDLDGTSVPALGGLVALDLATGKPGDARARITARLAADASNPLVLDVAGRAYTAMGDAKKAEETWRKLIQVQPANFGAYVALGQLLYAQGRLEEARREFEQYAEREPASVGAHTMVGILLQAQNRNDEAQKRYERTLEINRDAPVAANNLAWLYAERNGNLDVALQLAQTAKRQMPDSPEVDDTLGWIYYKKGLAALAVASFQQSTAKAPNNAGYLYRLGLAQLKTGDTAKARESLEKALKVGGEFREAAEARRILANLG
jgi:tetratricopeptide (TPR) repeat protein